MWFSSRDITELKCSSWISYFILSAPKCTAVNGITCFTVNVIDEEAPPIFWPYVWFLVPPALSCCSIWFYMMNSSLFLDISIFDELTLNNVHFTKHIRRYLTNIYYDPTGPWLWDHMKQIMREAYAHSRSCREVLLVTTLSIHGSKGSAMSVA